MTTLAERISRALADGSGKSKAGLARACGIKPPSVSAWVSGETASLEAKNLLAAAGYLGVRPIWLATGNGPMRGESAALHWPFEGITPEAWHHLTERQKGAVEQAARSTMMELTTASVKAPRGKRA